MSASKIFATILNTSGIIRRILGIPERYVGYQIALKKLDELQKVVSIQELINAIVPNKKLREEILKKIWTDPNLMPSVGFLEYLKLINLKVARQSLELGIISPTWGYQYSQLVNALLWSYGFGWQSWVTLSPLLSTLVSDKARRRLIEIVRDKKLSESKYERLFMSGLIDERTFKEILRREGYSDIDIELYIEYLKEEKMTKDKDLTKSEILRLYQENLISRQKAMDMLMSLGYDPDEADYLLDLIDLKKEAEEEKKKPALTKSTILSAFRKRLIDKQTAKELLIRLGYEEKSVEILLELEDKIRRAKDRPRERDITKSDVLKAFRIGLIDYDTAKEFLMALGYSESEAIFLLEIERYKLYESRQASQGGGT